MWYVAIHANTTHMERTRPTTLASLSWLEEAEEASSEEIFRSNSLRSAAATTVIEPEGHGTLYREKNAKKPACDG